MNRAQRVIKSFKDKLKEKDNEVARLNEENERLKLCIESNKRTLDDDRVDELAKLVMFSDDMIWTKRFACRILNHPQVKTRNQCYCGEKNYENEV